MLKMNVNSNSTKQMQAIIAKVDTFPNRIASIQQSALIRTGNNLHGKLYDKFPASYYLRYEISTAGRLGYRLSITPERGARTSTGADSFIAASVFLYGRKKYNVRAKRAKYMRLRDESVPPYRQYIRQATIPAMKGRSDELKMLAREEIIKNLEYAIKRFGFGPRGGSTGLEDLPSVRSRAR